MDKRMLNGTACECSGQLRYLCVASIEDFMHKTQKYTCIKLFSSIIKLCECGALHSGKSLLFSLFSYLEFLRTFLKRLKMTILKGTC